MDGSTRGSGRSGEATPRPVNLALQGGGAHGALTWGVLDRLLEDPRLSLNAISGTSAGAMNAVVLAQGWAEGGRTGARAALGRFWRAVSDAARFSPIQRSLWDRLLGRYSLEYSPAYLFFEQLSRQFSPYELNPLNINPLRDLLATHVDFDRINRLEDLTLFVTATNVRTGRARIFQTGALSVDAVMASACLPQLFPAVEIDGEAYWDGGYIGNPALYPLVEEPGARDIVIVQINPIERPDLPRSARAITNRVNEISFNASLIKELRAIHLLDRLIEAEGLEMEFYRDMNLHLIHADYEVQRLEASSKLNAEWDYLRMLFAKGRGWGERWLAENAAAIGERSTLDLEALFEDTFRPAGIKRQAAE